MSRWRLGGALAIGVSVVLAPPACSSPASSAPIDPDAGDSAQGEGGAVDGASSGDSSPNTSCTPFGNNAPVVTVEASSAPPPKPLGGGFMLGPYFDLVSSVQYVAGAPVGSRRQHKMILGTQSCISQCTIGEAGFDSILRVDDGPEIRTSGRLYWSPGTTVRFVTECPSGVVNASVEYSSDSKDDAGGVGATFELHYIERSGATVTSHRVDTYRRGPEPG